MKKYVRATMPAYNEKFKIKKFQMIVHNHLGKKKIYKMHYVIIPPKNN